MARTRVLWAATVFLGSGLLFVVQPMIAKMLLPRVGGAPSTWTTCVLFFQAALLAGYVYAHLMGPVPAGASSPTTAPTSGASSASDRRRRVRPRTPGALPPGTRASHRLQ
jgi:hypothetical protein